MQKKILWVLFFHQVEKMFSYFQNHTGRMIFLKMVSNFIFTKISHVKLKAISFFVRFFFYFLDGVPLFSSNLLIIIWYIL